MYLHYHNDMYIFKLKLHSELRTDLPSVRIPFRRPGSTSSLAKGQLTDPGSTERGDPRGVTPYRALFKAVPQDPSGLGEI